MTVLDLRAAPTRMEMNSDVQMVLFTHDGTTEVFALEETRSNHGHTQLEIYRGRARARTSPCERTSPCVKNQRRANAHDRPIIPDPVRRQPPR